MQRLQFQRHRQIRSQQLNARQFALVYLFYAPGIVESNATQKDAARGAERDQQLVARGPIWVLIVLAPAFYRSVFCRFFIRQQERALANAAPVPAEILYVLDAPVLALLP